MSQGESDADKIMIDSVGKKIMGSITKTGTGIDKRGL